MGGDKDLHLQKLTRDTLDLKTNKTDSLSEKNESESLILKIPGVDFVIKTIDHFLKPKRTPTGVFYRPGLLVSKTYQAILNPPDPIERMTDEMAERNSEEQRLQGLIMDKRIRRNFRNKTHSYKKVKFLNLAENNPYNYECQAYLEQVTKDLEKEGLWKEVASEALETDLFPIDDLRDADLDKNFEPRALDKIYNPHQTKKRFGINPLQELQEKGLEWKEREYEVTASDLPLLSEPTISYLLRRNPWNLDEVIARGIVEGQFLNRNPEIEKLFCCAYFVSKSIFDRKLFIQIKYEVFYGTRLQKRFRTYSYKRYKKDQVLFKRTVSEALKLYFKNNSHIENSILDYLNENSLSDKKLHSLVTSIWKRFLEAQKDLTEKQSEALELVYTDVPKMTYTDAAQFLKISRDSFQDRINGAVKKIKSYLPELTKLKSDLAIINVLNTRYLYNGLYDKFAANKVHTLYQVNPEYLNRKIDIEPRPGKPILKPYRNEIMVRAWSIYTTPVPDFHDTDYFCGLFTETSVARKTGKSAFRK